MRTTTEKLVRQNLYGFVYGATGVGKTCLATTLIRNGTTAGYVIADRAGPTSLVNLGMRSLPVELIPESGDPFLPTIKAVHEFANDPKIAIICVDDATTISGRAVDYLSGGEGERALGFDGWAEMLNGFRKLEVACDAAAARGKSIIITAMELPPTFENTMGGESLKEEGRAYIMGKSRIWLPKNCDFVARLTARFVQGKYEGKLWLARAGAAEHWEVKNRWGLPSPAPADLRPILQHIQKAVKPPITK